MAYKYDLIYIFLPSVALDENDIKVLSAYVKAGGRLVLQGENSGYSGEENANLTQLAKALGTSFHITTKNIGGGFETVAEINLGTDLLGGVPLNGDMSFYCFAEIEYDEPAEVIASYLGSPGIVDQAVEKGRITVFSDMNFYDPGRATNATNDLLLRLLLNSSENKDIVEDGGDPNEDFGKECKLNANIEIEEYTWSSVSDEVTEVFFAQPQTVMVKAQDIKCGIEHVQVLSSNTVLSEDEIIALSDEDWTELEVTDGTGNYELDTEGSYLVYAKVTDGKGNEKVLSTDKITIDMTAPVIYGIEEEKFYCQSASFTVEDTYLASVTMDGNELEPDEEGTYHVDMTKDVHSIKAVDKAGNTTIITLKGGHVWNYEAVENKIYANCSNSGCKYESEALCLQLNAKTPVDYTGEPYKQVTFENEITEVTGEVAGEIVYYKVGANQELGEALTAPPTEAGKYVATMTLGGKMAKAPFEIVAPITYYTVSFPGERIGYDVAIKEGYKNPVPCNGDYAFYVDVKPGYDQNTLVVTANGKMLIPKNGLYTITGIGRDGRNVQVGITVLDRIAPTGTIQIQEDTWNVLQKNVDFDRFYTTAQTVEIKGLDLGVGVQSISYCITDKEITETEIDSLNWIPYKSKFAIHPNLRGYIYAKIVDKEGNTTYISTCGLIFEAPDGKEDVWKNEEVKKFEEYAYKQTTDEDLKGSFYNKIRARAVVKKKNKIQLKWNVVKDADGYIVYGNRCNTSKKKYKIKKLKTITDPYKTDWTHTKVKKGTYYKYTVAAYKVINGKKKVLSVSKMVHAVSKGGKYTNPTGVKVKKKTITLKVGKKKRIKATRTIPKGGKMKEHTKKFRYESSDKSVATINKKGVITAKKKGTCYGFVYVLNGTYTTVKIKVK